MRCPVAPGRSTQAARRGTSKRDNKLFEFLVEARTTSAGSYSISRNEFFELKRQAHATPPGFMPAMQVDIRDLSGIFLELQIFNEMQRLLIETGGPGAEFARQAQRA